MGFGLFLLDGKEVSIYKLENRRKISLTKIDKIFKVCICSTCSVESQNNCQFGVYNN